MTKEFNFVKEDGLKKINPQTNVENYLLDLALEHVYNIDTLKNENLKLKEKHHKATNKITEFAKENKTLKQTILLMEENQRQKEQFWIGGSVQPEDNSLEIKQLESDVYKYKTRWEATEKELKETQEDNLVYYDILSTLLTDPEQAIDIYMQGRRRGELDE